MAIKLRLAPEVAELLRELAGAAGVSAWVAGRVEDAVHRARRRAALARRLDVPAS